MPQAHECQTSLWRDSGLHGHRFHLKHLDPNPSPDLQKPGILTKPLLSWLLVGPPLPRSAQLAGNTFWFMKSKDAGAQRSLERLGTFLSGLLNLSLPSRELTWPLHASHAWWQVR